VALIFLIRERRLFKRERDDDEYEYEDDEVGYWRDYRSDYT